MAVVLVILIVGYWLPALVACMRHKSNSGSILVVNLFLGWSLIGWVVALAMAVAPERQYAV